MITFLLDLLFPKFCFRCENYGSYFCAECIWLTPRLLIQLCVVCQKPSLAGLTHPKCVGKFLPDRLTVLYDYHTYPIANLIVQGKYNFVPDIFKGLGRLLASELICPPDFTVIAVPLSIKRKRWRGFNQTEIIAKVFAETHQLAYCDSLKRIKNTKTQKDLSKSARLKNMSAAFLFEGKAPEKILLIDDVATTGATLLSATKALKQAGAKYVWCVAIAQD